MSSARVFQCPSCHEFIATDAKSCRFCSTPVDAQVAHLAADSQEKENKAYRRKQYARHMLVGGGLLALGLVVTVGSYVMAAPSRGGGNYVITYGLMLAGGADFLYGVVGWAGELKR